MAASSPEDNEGQKIMGLEGQWQGGSAEVHINRGGGRAGKILPSCTAATM